MRSLRLTAALDEKGGGEGTLVLDPNLKTFDLFGRAKSTTLMAFDVRKVTFEQMERDNQQTGGHKCYEIKGHKLDRRLFLVTPGKGSTTYRLVSIANKDKAPDVLLLETEAPSGK